MHYLIYYNGTPFYTNWFTVENNYVDGMVVFDLLNHEYTNDGKEWKEITEDHL